jgi:hypothetical protein
LAFLLPKLSNAPEVDKEFFAILKKAWYNILKKDYRGGSMAKFFKVVGFIFLIGDVLLLFAALSNGRAEYVISFFYIVLIAIMSIAVGDLIERVGTLEGRLRNVPLQEKPVEEIVQVSCPDCGEQHDSDDQE